MKRSEALDLVEALTETIPNDSTFTYSMSLVVGFQGNKTGLTEQEVRRFLGAVKAYLTNLSDTDETAAQILLSVDHPLTAKLMEKTMKIYEARAKARQPLPGPKTWNPKDPKTQIAD